MPTNIILIECLIPTAQVQLHDLSPVKHNQPLEHHHYNCTLTSKNKKSPKPVEYHVGVHKAARTCIIFKNDIFLKNYCNRPKIIFTKESWWEIITKHLQYLIAEAMPTDKRKTNSSKQVQ